MDQTISFSPALTAMVGTTANLSATTNTDSFGTTESSGLTVTFASSPATVCTISRNTVSFVSAGNCIVTANQVGDEDFNAAKEVSATIVVSTAPKTDQTIFFSPALTGTVGGIATNLSATASSGLTAITFASSPATVCTISGNTVSFVSAGNCMVTANQVGNDKFNAAKEMSATIVVGSGFLNQTLTLTSALTGTAGQTGTLSATADSGLTPITFATSSTDICEVVGNNVTYKAQGKCTIKMSQIGNAMYKAVEQSTDINVISKGTFTLEIANELGLLISQATSGDTLKLSLTFKAKSTDVGKMAKFYLKATAGLTTAGLSTLMLTDKGFVPATEPLQAVTSVTLPPDQITLPLYTGFLPSGKYSIYAAYETADSKEEATSIFNVKAKSPLSFTNLPISAIVGEQVDLTLTGNHFLNSNPIVLTSTTADICTIVTGTHTVSFIAEGNCIVQAKQLGSELFADGSAFGKISVASAGVFSVKLTDKDGKPITQATDKDTSNIGLIFSALANDIGKTATFYLTATAGRTKLMFANGAWVAATNPLQPAASNIPLKKDVVTLPLFSGTLPVDKYTIQATYQTADGNKVEATAAFNVLSADYLGVRDAFATKLGSSSNAAAAMFADRAESAATYPYTPTDQAYAEKLYLKSVAQQPAPSSASSNLSDRQKQKLLEDITKSLYLDNGK